MRVSASGNMRRRRPAAASQGTATVTFTMGASGNTDILVVDFSALGLPALASQLHALHGFEEDLRAALGVDSLYNTSLGTINDVHNYDRVEGR